MSTEVAPVALSPSQTPDTPTLDLIIEVLAWLILGIVPLAINVFNVDAYRTIQAAYSTMLLAVLVAAWATGVTLSGRWGEIRKMPFLAPLSGFALWSLITWVFSSPSKPTSAASWINLVLYGLFFFTLSDFAVRKPAFRWRLCVPIFVAFSFNVVTGLMQHKGVTFLGTGPGRFTGLYTLWPIKTLAVANYFAGLQAPSRLLSAAGTLGNQNVLGGYLSVTIPLFGVLPVIIVTSWNSIRDRILWRFKTLQEGSATFLMGTVVLLLGAVALASLACLLATDTRGAWLGLLAGLFVGLLVIPAFFKDQVSRFTRARWTKIGVAAGVLLVVIGGLAYSAGVTPQMLKTHLGDPNTVRQRLVAWQVATEMASENPIFGKGLGTYKIDYFRDLAKLYDGKPIPSYMHNRYVQAHNDFVQEAGEEGWPGLIFGVAILVAFWLALPRYVWRTRPPPSESLLLVASMVGTVGLCVFGLTNFPFHIASSSTAFVAVAAMAGGSLFGERRTTYLAANESAAPKAPLPLEARWALSGAIGVCALAIIGLTYMPYQADQDTKAGMELYKRGQVAASAAKLNQAIRLDPERGDARLILGILDAMMNNFKGAEYQFIRCQTSYDDVTLHYYLGRVYEVEKRYADARREYLIAQSYFPADSPVGRAVLARLNVLNASASALTASGSSAPATVAPARP